MFKHFAATPALLPFELWRPSNSSWCNQEVKGESHYLPALRKIVAAVDDRSEVETTALLIAEPDNRHDPNAVVVQIDGMTVGYLPREVAPNYQPWLLQLAANGLVAQVPCRIWKNRFTDYEYDRRGRAKPIERFSASVTVALAEPHLCIPVNQPPVNAHVVLPSGSAIQISGEEQHMDALEPFLRDEGASMVYATLHPFVQDGRQARELVEVRLDGSVVGTLTPKMSSDLLPAIKHLQGRGYQTAAKARIVGNRLKAEVVLNCARAHELSADWPGALPVIATSSRPLHGEDVSQTVPSAAPLRPVIIPPKPKVRFAAPPGWPPPPDGWEPVLGWQPEANWPAPPSGWHFWTIG